MTRQDMINLVTIAPSIPLTMKAFAIAAINLASADQLRAASDIFSEAESVFKAGGVEGLREFLKSRGVPQEGIALLERIAPYAASQANASHD